MAQFNDTYPTISQIKLPNGSIYDIKDAAARAAISAGIQIVVIGQGEDLPTASQDTMGKIYFKYAPGTDPGVGGTYDEYVTVQTGSEEPYTYTWEKIGNTDVNLSDYSKNTHYHTVTSTTKYLHKENVPLTFGTTSALTGTTKQKLALGSVTGVSGSTSVTGVSGSTTASKATAGTAVNVATVDEAVVYGKANVGESVNVGKALSGTTTFNTDAIKAASLTGTTTFNTDAIKAASLTGTTTFSTDAISDASLTGTTTFNTDAIKAASLTGTTTFAIGGVVVTAPASDSELLEFSLASTGTVGISTTAASTGTVGISTTAASTGTVGISTTAASTGTVGIETTAASTGTVSLETMGITPAIAAPSGQTIVPAKSNGTITPYTFADVTVPVADASATTVPVAAAEASTFATGSLTDSGNGANVVTDTTSANVYSSIASEKAVYTTIDTVSSNGEAFVESVNGNTSAAVAAS